MIKQVLQTLYNLIATLWHNHDYDYDDVQMAPRSESIDANVTSIQTIEIFFTARCKYCGKPINVNRYTFKNPTFREIAFCRRDPIIYAQWLERRIERDKELAKGPISFDEQTDGLLKEIDQADKRHKKPLKNQS